MALGRTIYCRYGDCGEAYLSIAGYRPAVCPKCNRSAQWSTIAPFVAIHPYPDPTKPYDINLNDARFLRSIKVDPETHETIE